MQQMTLLGQPGVAGAEMMSAPIPHTQPVRTRSFGGCYFTTCANGTRNNKIEIAAVAASAWPARHSHALHALRPGRFSADFY
jgi:hypothetical protein